MGATGSQSSVKLVILFLYTQPNSSMNNCNNLHLKFLLFLQCKFLENISTMKESYVTTNANLLFQNEKFRILLNHGNLCKTSFILSPKFSKYNISTFLQAFLFSARSDRQTFKSFVYVPLCSNELGLSTSYLWYCLIYFSISGKAPFLPIYHCKQLLSYIAFGIYFSDKSFTCLIEA